MDNKNPTIDVIKGLAIFLVVCGHVIQRTMVVQAEDFFLNPAFKTIYTFHMPLFVFVSGYLMAGTVQRRSIADAIKNRGRSLLVPCMAWGILDVLVLYGLQTFDGNSANFANLWVDQLLLYPAVWFLWTLAASTVLLLLSVQLEKKLGAVAFAIVGVLLWFIPSPANQYFGIYYIQWFYLFYLAGFLVSRAKGRLHPFLSVVCLALFIALLPHWNKDDYIYIHHMQSSTEIGAMLYRYGMGFLGIAITFAVGQFLLRTKSAAFLAIVGVYSLDIYLLQRYLVEGLYPRLVARAGVSFDFNSPMTIFVLTPLAALFFIVICIFISKATLRKNNLLNRLLLGGRI